MSKQYRRCGSIPLSRKVSHTEYQKIRRSNDPIATAQELDVLDVDVLKEMSQKLKRLI